VTTTTRTRRRGNIDHNSGLRAMAKLAELNAADAEKRAERAAKAAATASKPVTVAETQLKLPAAPSGASAKATPAPAKRQWRYEHSQLPHEGAARNGRAAPTLAMALAGFVHPLERPRLSWGDRKADKAIAQARAEMAR